MEDIVDRLRVLNFMGPWEQAADEIERLRLANSDLQMHYDYARTECDNLTAQHKVLREATTDLLNAINGLFPTDGPVKARVRAALKEKE